MKLLLKILPYILIAFLLYRIVYLNKQNTILIDKTATLEENLKNKTIIYKDKIVYKERVVNGTEVKQTTVYVPIDGKIEILTPAEQEKLNLGIFDKAFNHIIKQEDGSVILVKNKGFTLAPEISALYSNKLELGFQIKVFYWSRYNAGVGITNEETLYGYISRNISDIIPFIRNSSAQVAYGKDLDEGNTKFLFGVNVRL
jgi:hypothetical protein